MSLLWSLKKLVDPNAARLDEAEARTERRRPHRSEEGDPPDPEEIPDVALPEHPAGGRYRCRVCGRESPERAYCPVCLADTMVPARP